MNLRYFSCDPGQNPKKLILFVHLRDVTNLHENTGMLILTFELSKCSCYL